MSLVETFWNIAFQVFVLHFNYDILVDNLKEILGIRVFLVNLGLFHVNFLLHDPLGFLEIPSVVSEPP